jgi:hypothetical protein
MCTAVCIFHTFVEERERYIVTKADIFSINSRDVRELSPSLCPECNLAGDLIGCSREVLPFTGTRAPLVCHKHTAKREKTWAWIILG